MNTVDIEKLPAEERLKLLDRLWESLADIPDAVPVTPAQRAELDERLDELDTEGPVGIPWNDVLQEVRSRST